MKKTGRVFVVGIDGATYKVIEPMIRAGKLPNIKKVMDSGTSATLFSTVPPLSPVAWTSISTGASPGRHRITDFLVFDKQKKGTHFYDATMRKVKPIWSVLSELGRRVCVINVPMTYPVDKVNGFMISGLGTPPTNEGFAHPMETYNEMAAATGGYKIDINVREGSTDFEHISKSISEVMDQRLKALRFLLAREKWDFFMLVFTTTDRAQHFFWKFADPSHPRYNRKLAKKYETVISDAYEKSDIGVGEVLKHAGPDDTIVLVSDHGFGPLRKKFSLSKWMLGQGYIALKPRKGGGRPGVLTAVKRLVPADLVHFLVRNVFKSRIHNKGLVSGVTELLDLDRTRAFAHKKIDSFFIYLNDELLAGTGELAACKKELMDKLRLITDPETGDPIFRDVVEGVAQYGAAAATTPDIVITPKDGYGITFELGNLHHVSLFEPSDVWSGTHNPDGIFVISGPNIGKGRRLEAKSVIDVAPTLYALLGIPVPRAADGAIARECFIDDLSAHGPAAAEADESQGEKEGVLTEHDSEAIAKSLKDLGYL